MEDLLSYDPHGMDRRSVDSIHAMGSVVYFIFAVDELLYVGQSRNFKHRVKMHRARFDKEAEFVCDERLKNLSFTAIPVPEEQLDEVEFYYIQKFLPPYNTDMMPAEILAAYSAVRVAKAEVVLAKIELEEAIEKYRRKLKEA